VVAAGFSGSGELHAISFDGATCAATLSYTDTSGDDVSDSIVYDFFDGLDVDSGDYLSVAVDDGTTTRAWCVERADWYVDNYLAEAAGPGKHLKGGSWNRWYNTGSGWSSPTTSGKFNSFGPFCNGKAYSFCGEWHLGGQRLMVSPGHTGYGETYDYVGSRSLDRELTITVGPTRESACGF